MCNVKQKSKKYVHLFEELKKIENLHSIEPETLKERLTEVNKDYRKKLADSLKSVWVRLKGWETSLLNWVWALKGRVRFWVCMDF